MTKPKPAEVGETAQQWADRQIRESGPMPVHIALKIANIYQQVAERKRQEADATEG